MTNYNIKTTTNNKYNNTVPSENIYNIKTPKNNNYKATVSEKQT